MRAIVTGSSGFIGSGLISQLLDQGIEVGVLARSSSKVNGNVNECFIYEYSLLECEAFVSNWKPDIFFHLAWKGTDSSSRNDTENNKYNYRITIDSVELAVSSGCNQWIGAGSQAEYGFLNDEVDEDHPTSPVSEYGITKKRLYDETKGLCEKYHLLHTWARIFSVYGPRDHSSSFISYLIDSMLVNDNIKVSSCTQKWDYLYVDDAVRALCSLVGDPGVFNIASGEVVALEEVVKILSDIIEYKAEIKWGFHTDGPLNYLHGNINKIKQKTGWRPTLSLKEGLNKTVKYYQEI
jgi:nucleoside-diphosphate-sugar epimerase